MIATTHSKKDRSDELLEDEFIRKAEKYLKNRKNKRKPEAQENIDERENLSEVAEIPFAEVEPLPEVVKENSPTAEQKEIKPYKNRAPLQDDEKGVILIKEALKNPVNITTEDLLNISDAARQGLKKWLTKKRVEKITISLLDEKAENVIHAENLPCEPFEVLDKERSGVPAGSLIVGDPVVQYLGSLKKGEIPKKIIVAQESQGLRAVHPLINEVKEMESLLDGGSQIVSMAKEAAIELKIEWDPGIKVHMESANKSLQETLGLAKNVPFLFGNIKIYLQIHIMDKPAYQVLLGRPFDSITESLVKNDRDGSQRLTITDPNTGLRCTMATHERGKRPSKLEKFENLDFQLSMN
jgi:hypothetical protein